MTIGTRLVVLALAVMMVGCGGPTTRERAAKITYCKDFVLASVPVQTAYADIAYPAIVKVLRSEFHAAANPGRIAPVLTAPSTPSRAVIETIRKRLLGECSSPRLSPDVQLTNDYLTGKFTFP